MKLRNPWKLFWKDDLERMAWLGAKEHLIKPETVMWIILSDDSSIAKSSVRYGLSMLALCQQSKKGHGSKILILHREESLCSKDLPTPLKGADILHQKNANLGAKIVVKLNLPSKTISPEYRLELHTMHQIGQWIEVGPVTSRWEGALMGVHEGRISAHGVGPSGKLPQKAILEYPVMDMKLVLNDDKYTAWGVKNILNKNFSYYIRIEDSPASILFGPMPSDDEADFFVLNLK